MKTISQKPKKSLSNQKLNRIKTIIESRWSEVWQVVLDRERNRYCQTPDTHQQNADF
jgi:hypothetical protein